MATARLTSKLVGGVIYSVAIFGVLLFLPAWTLQWWRAWVLLGVVSVASSFTMFGIFPSRPDLLDERYKSPIQQGQPLADKIVLQALMLSFFGLVVFIPLDVFRLHLLGGPGLRLATLGLVLFAAGWTVIALALRENAFAAPVVRHQEERGQVVVETGPYRIVRHPMYAGAIPLMIGMPLWLGSYAGALLAAVPVTTLALRVLGEERFLRRELPGYGAYTRRVRWRLVPGVW
jgi:protein-S-isoprenylcysteine O-methyltransferase Ste14